MEKSVWWNPDLKITGWCSEDGQKLLCAAQEPSGTRDGRQLRWWLGGRTVERRATIWTTLQCQLVFLNPISPGGEGRQICPNPAQTRIPVKNQWAEILIISVWSGDHWVGQKCLIRGGPYKWCQSCLWALKCKKTFSNSYYRGLSEIKLKIFTRT